MSTITVIGNCSVLLDAPAATTEGTIIPANTPTVIYPKTHAQCVSVVGCNGVTTENTLDEYLARFVEAGDATEAANFDPVSVFESNLL